MVYRMAIPPLLDRVILANISGEHFVAVERPWILERGVLGPPATGSHHEGIYLEPQPYQPKLR